MAERPAVELFHEAQHFHAEGLSLYVLGQLDLVHRARIDDLFYAIAHAVRARLTYAEKSHRPVLDELDERLVDKYFVNFSRSEEHTSELQSLMRISYAVFCWKKKKN